MNIVKCPHCETYIEIVELNCKIFRCGIYKDSMKQIDPHMQKSSCAELSTNGLIYGCGKPFRVDLNGKNEYISTVCDYI